MNNFDTSSNGVNIEFNGCWDSDIAQMQFDDNFEILSSGYRQTPLYLFGGVGVESIKYKVNKHKLMEAYHREHSLGSKEDLLEDFTHYSGDYISYASLEDVIDFIRHELSVHEFYEFMQTYGNYFIVACVGYCQGDYVEVIVLDGYDITTESLENLLFSQPIYARLVVNDDEYYIDEQLKDCYTWDKEEVLEVIRRILPDSDKKDYVLSWCEDNIPTELKYI